MNSLSSATRYTADMAGRPPINEAPVFGRNLAALRKSHGWTQPQLAEKLGISVDMLTYYERRARNPTAEFVAKAAAALEVSADELLGHSVKATKRSGPPSKLQKQIEEIRRLPRAKQRFVSELLDTVLQKSS